MAYTTGTATDYHDLLDKLRTYAVAQGWVQERWTAPGSLTAVAELWLRGPGTGAGRRTYVGIQSTSDATNNIYSWGMVCATGFNSGLGFLLQPGVSSQVYLNLWTSTIDYWFFVNDRRIIVVAKVSTSYMSAFMGQGLPMTIPAEYPFPLVCIGSYFAPALPAFNNSGSRMCADPGVGAATLRDRGGTWRIFGNHARQDNLNYNINFNAINSYYVWPYRASAADWYSNDFRYRMRANGNGESLLIQCHVLGSNFKEGIALEGLFWLPGFSRAAEQQITVGSRTFRVFQNTFRATDVDYFAVEEI